MPAGVSYEGVFGRRAEGIPGGVVAGVVGGVLGGLALSSSSVKAAPNAAPVSIDPSEFVAPTEIPKEVPPPESQQQKQQPSSKLHPWIAAVIKRLSNKDTKPGDDEAKFVKNGKAEVQVWLARKSPKIIEQLNQLGFEVSLDSKTEMWIAGRLPIENLEALAKLESVRYIAPRTS